MSVMVIHSETVKARKEYYDDCWEFISEWIGGGCWVEGNRRGEKKAITFAEARLLVQYRNRTLKGSKILPGELYQRQFNSYEGKTYTWRAKKFFYELACKYDLFPEL